MRFDLGILASGERSLPLGYLFKKLILVILFTVLEHVYLSVRGPDTTVYKKMTFIHILLKVHTFPLHYRGKIEYPRVSVPLPYVAQHIKWALKGFENINC